MKIRLRTSKGASPVQGRARMIQAIARRLVRFAQIVSGLDGERDTVRRIGYNNIESATNENFAKMQLPQKRGFVGGFEPFLNCIERAFAIGNFSLLCGLEIAHEASEFFD